MRITESQLRRIVREEIVNNLREGRVDEAWWNPADWFKKSPAKGAAAGKAPAAGKSAAKPGEVQLTGDAKQKIDNLLRNKGRGNARGIALMINDMKDAAMKRALVKYIDDNADATLVNAVHEIQKELMQTGDTRTSKQKRDQELSDFLGTLKF